MAEKTFGKFPKKGATVTIGIDQSLTGFALTLMDIETPESYVTWVYKSSFNGVKRLADIRQWMMNKLRDAIVEHNLSFYDVAMEGTVLASHSALVLGELAATVKLTFWDSFLDTNNSTLATPLQIPPMTLKKFASGKGNSKKQEMLMQIYKRWGIEFNDDNAADSYALARLAGKVFIGDIETAISEQIKDPKYRDQNN